VRIKISSGRFLFGIAAGFLLPKVKITIICKNVMMENMTKKVAKRAG